MDGAVEDGATGRGERRREVFGTFLDRLRAASSSSWPIGRPCESTWWTVARCRVTLQRCVKPLRQNGHDRV